MQVSFHPSIKKWNITSPCLNKTLTYDVTHGNISPQVFSSIKDQTGAPYTTKKRNHEKDKNYLDNRLVLRAVKNCGMFVSCATFDIFIMTVHMHYFVIYHQN